MGNAAGRASGYQPSMREERHGEVPCFQTKHTANYYYGPAPGLLVWPAPALGHTPHATRRTLRTPAHTRTHPPAHETTPRHVVVWGQQARSLDVWQLEREDAVVLREAVCVRVLGDLLGVPQTNPIQNRWRSAQFFFRWPQDFSPHTAPVPGARAARGNELAPRCGGAEGGRELGGPHHRGAVPLRLRTLGFLVVAGEERCGVCSVAAELVPNDSPYVLSVSMRSTRAKLAKSRNTPTWLPFAPFFLRTRRSTHSTCARWAKRVGYRNTQRAGAGHARAVVRSGAMRLAPARRRRAKRRGQRCMGAGG